MKSTLLATATAVILGLPLPNQAAPKEGGQIKEKTEKRGKTTDNKRVKADRKGRKTDTSRISAKIDELVEAGYAKHGVTANPEASDEIFVRRIYLDIIGRIPTRAESVEFLSSKDPNKRAALIDKLLDSEGYVAHFYNYWADILRINNALGNGARAAEAAYNLWVKDSLRHNKPYDQFVYEMVTAEGKIWENGAVGYYQRDRGMPLDNMSNTVRIFLGVRLECAQCHDHPFDKWTQMDYYKMAAFSHGMDTRRYDTPNQKAFTAMRQQQVLDKVAKASGIKEIDGKTLFDALRNRKSKNVEALGLDKEQMAKLREEAREVMAISKEEDRDLRRVINDLYNPIRYIAIHGKERDLKLPHDYQYNDAKPHDVVDPKTMFGADVDANDHESLIAAYGSWMTSAENPTFTKVVANRLWKKAFGVGLSEPVDEITEHSFISNPELMAYLEKVMRDQKYDMKEFLRALYNSKTYQREAFTGDIQPGVAYHFPGPALRRLSAEQIWDSLVSMTLPEADRYMPGVKGRLSSIEKSRQIYDALEGRTPEQYAEMVNEVAKSIDGVYEKQQDLREKFLAAREAKDEEKAREFQKAIRDLTTETRAKVSAIAYTDPSSKERSEEQLLASAGMAEMSMMAAGTSSNQIVTKRPKVSLPDPPEGLTKDQARNWKKSMSAQASAFSRSASNLMRSSELPSPAPRGHFLREFGQSDREVIQNASNEASVPQALALLNGPTIDLITNRFSVFGDDIASAESTSDLIDRIYMTMLSRPATDREKALLSEKLEADSRHGTKHVIWALLNTQQFLFIQ